MALEKTLRWFGPDDPVSLDEIWQTGVSGVVTALHHIPNGAVWPAAEIMARQELLKRYELSWHVVESLPVHHEIKAGLTRRDELIDNYIRSMNHLAAAGIDTLCYNFMPVLDWVRTSLDYRTSRQGLTLQYDHSDFALFDLHILKREKAEQDYSDPVLEEAAKKNATWSAEQKHQLAETIILVTQSFVDGFSADAKGEFIQGFKNYLSEYQHIDSQMLRHNLSYFLDAVLPEAQKLGIRMAIHPDDPAFPVLGLPRIVSQPEDLRWIFSAHPSVSNGLTFCTGSFSSNRENPIQEMAVEFRDRTYFLHLRNTRYLGERAFVESGHLQGDLDMVRLMGTFLETNRSIPMRPDHGLGILSDHSSRSYPGYPLIGRVIGLAELAGMEAALLHKKHD